MNANNSTILMNRSIQLSSSSYIAANILHLIGVLFHSCGFYLLLKVKKTQTNNIVAFSNKRLLALLSSSEIGNALFCIAAYTSLLFSAPLNVVGISSLMSWISNALSLSAIYLITFNRLVSSVNPLWYRKWMTKRKFF